MNAEIRLYVQLTADDDEGMVAEAASLAERVADLVAEEYGLKTGDDGEAVRGMVVVRPLEFDGEGDEAFILHALDGSAGSYIVVHPDTSASELGMIVADTEGREEPCRS